MFQRLAIVIAIVLVAGAIFLIFGRGLLQGVLPTSGTPGISTSDEAQVDNSNLTSEQAYAQTMGPALEQVKAWRNGPIAERTDALAAKLDTTGPLSNLTYGNFLLLYLNAQAAGTQDLAMDWIVSETVSPKLQPIYETIATDSTAIAAAITDVPAPAELSEPQNRLLQCLNYEGERAQQIVDILMGNSSASVPERSSDPCATVDADIEAIDSFISANTPS